LFDGDKVGLGWPDQPLPADASERQLLPATSKAISKVGCNSLKLQDLAERGGFNSALAKSSNNNGKTDPLATQFQRFNPRLSSSFCHHRWQNKNRKNGMRGRQGKSMVSAIPSISSSRAQLQGVSARPSLFKLASNPEYRLFGWSLRTAVLKRFPVSQFD
jgi:hypothetical protein